MVPARSTLPQHRLDILRKSSSHVTAMFRMQAVCSVYSAALAAVTEGIPWIRVVDVWHVSSVPEHEAVFLPEPQPVLDSASLSAAIDDEITEPM